ncbi:MAG: hypothetical protein JKY37_07750 [Nannocystaceae bacterium]|nr:hypothetical protein [Nannocystaceae bacterium]
MTEVTYGKWWITINGTEVEQKIKRRGSPQLILELVWFKVEGVRKSVITENGDRAKVVTAVRLEPLCKDITEPARLKMLKPYRDNVNEWVDLEYDIPGVGEADADHVIGVTTQPGWSLRVKVKPKVETACV